MLVLTGSSTLPREPTKRPIGLVSLVGALLYISLLQSQASPHVNNSEKHHAVTIAPGVVMPIINFGGINVEDVTGHEPVLRTSQQYFPGELIGLDTAIAYGKPTQEEIGELVRSEKIVPRSQVFLGTKVSCICGKVRKLTCYQLGKLMVNAAMKNLGTDGADLLMMHAPCEFEEEDKHPMHIFNNTATYEFYRAMEDSMDKYNIKSLGLSNFNVGMIRDLLGRALKTRPAMVQNGYSVGVHAKRVTLSGRDEPTFRVAKEEGIQFVSYSPLGLWTEFDVLGNPTVAEIAKSHGKTPAQVAIRWLVQQDIVVTTFSDKPEHIREDLDVFDFELTAEDMEKLSNV
jgi:2,5-diketo-D-gluconate reductase A